MRILIIGGTGRLGQMLRARLAGYEVTTLSRREIGNIDSHISADVLTFEDYTGYDVVVNCAAMKDVAKCQEQVEECVQINFMGVMASLKAAQKCGVGRYIYISTDMAADVESVYGASKMLADQLVVNSAQDGQMQTAVIRLGNIIAREGSIFTILASKGKELGYIPITDSAMTRFLMRDSECADFVIDAILRPNVCGEIYAPRCKAYRIGDVAAAVAPQLEQRIVGLRAGDALSVTMVAQREVSRTQIVGDCYVIHPQWAGRNFGDVKAPVNSANNFSYATIEELTKLYNTLI